MALPTARVESRCMWPFRSLAFVLLVLCRLGIPLPNRAIGFVLTRVLRWARWRVGKSDWFAIDGEVEVTNA